MVFVGNVRVERRMLMRAVVILLAANLFQKIILTQNSKELTLIEDLKKFDLMNDTRRFQD